MKVEITLYTIIRDSKDDLSHNGLMMRDSFMYANWYTHLDCGFIHRDCNKVANFLAHWARQGNTSIWLKDLQSLPFICLILIWIVNKLEFYIIKNELTLIKWPLDTISLYIYIWKMEKFNLFL